VLPRLVAELSAELGAGRVGVLVLADVWTPDARTRLAPFGAAPDAPHHPLTSSAIEPTRLVAPSLVPRGAFSPCFRLARYEAVEWWRRTPQRRDLVAAWMGSRGDGVLGWVELGDEADVVRGWFD
jgi:protein ImuB